MVELRIALDGPVEVLDGTIILAFAKVCDATIHKGFGVVRIDLDRLIAVHYGAVVLALAIVSSTAAREGVRHL
jgi:hypothetical protein